MNKQPVYYLQTDPRWANKPYRVTGENSTIGTSGCGPTSAAMLISTITGETVTPEDTCAWSVSHGYKALNQGTYFSYFKPQFAAYGIECDQVSWTNTYGNPGSSIHDAVKAKLQEGYYIIALMGPGNWTSGGHFVVLWWQDDKVRINDSASTRDDRLNGDIQTFRSQVKYYWWVDARAYNSDEEDENMTDEKFAELMATWMKNQGAKDADNWAKDHIEQAKELGITDGSRPKAPATRQEVMVMVKNAVKQG